MNFSDPYVNAIFLSARKASKGLIRDFGEVEKLQVSLKGVSDFVSAADTKAERVLIRELSTLYPKFNILAEETGEIKNSENDVRWIIDPLDGTSNFVFSIPHFAISIALERNKEIISAGIYQPLTDEFFCYTLYVYFCYTLYVCFCYTLYVRNSKSLKLEKFEVGKDRSWKRSTLQKFEMFEDYY